MKLVDEISHIPMTFVAAGSFSAAISQDNKSLFLWGSGTFGQFLTPHRVKKIRGETSLVSIGDGFGVAMTEQGFLYSWGENNVGQLGSGDTQVKSTPQIMTHLDTKRVTSVACGRNFVIAMGQTLRQMARNDQVSLQESHEYLPPAQEYLPPAQYIPEREQVYEQRERVYDPSDGRGSKSFHREEHSPLRSKRRSTGRKKSSHRSTGKLHFSDRLHSG